MLTKDTCNTVNEVTIDKTCQTFKNGVQASIDINIPIKMIKRKLSVALLNGKLCKSIKRKARLHKQARQTGRYNSKKTDNAN